LQRRAARAMDHGDYLSPSSAKDISLLLTMLLPVCPLNYIKWNHVFIFCYLEVLPIVSILRQLLIGAHYLFYESGINNSGWRNRTGLVKLVMVSTF